MTTIAPAQSGYQGVAQIVRFNWPFYCIASTAILLAAIGSAIIPTPLWLEAMLSLGSALAGFWLIASLVVSHLVYDRSPLRQWRWIEPALEFSPKRWINIHAGLDESTPALRSLFAGSRGRVFDIFCAEEMTEPSILKARKRSLSLDSEAADFRKLPVENATCNAALLLLSAHELRASDSRIALFRELRRVLDVGGKIVLAEHLRDLPNFIAFGPGFLHFHSHQTWLHDAAAADLTLERTFMITPFITVFIFGRPL